MFRFGDCLNLRIRKIRFTYAIFSGRFTFRFLLFFSESDFAFVFGLVLCRWCVGCRSRSSGKQLDRKTRDRNKRLERVCVHCSILKSTVRVKHRDATATRRQRDRKHVFRCAESERLEELRVLIVALGRASTRCERNDRIRKNCFGFDGEMYRTNNVFIYFHIAENLPADQIVILYDEESATRGEIGSGIH